MLGNPRISPCGGGPCGGGGGAAAQPPRALFCARPACVPLPRRVRACCCWQAAAGRMDVGCGVTDCGSARSTATPKARHLAATTALPTAAHGAGGKQGVPEPGPARRVCQCAAIWGRICKGPCRCPAVTFKYHRTRIRSVGSTRQRGTRGEPSLCPSSKRWQMAGSPTLSKRQRGPASEGATLQVRASLLLNAACASLKSQLG